MTTIAPETVDLDGLDFDVPCECSCRRYYTKHDTPCTGAGTILASWDECPCYGRKSWLVCEPCFEALRTCWDCYREGKLRRA